MNDNDWCVIFCFLKAVIIIILIENVNKNFISRKEHPVDTRAKVIELTNEGKKTLNLALKDVEAFDEKFFAKIENEENFREDLIALFSEDI